MKRFLPVLAALPLAASAFAADTAPVYTDTAGKSWYLDHAAPTPPPPPAPAPVGIFGTDVLVGWDTNADLGLSGTSGNTDTMNLHAGLSTKHSAEAAQTKVIFTYDRTLNNGVLSQDRFVGEGTRDFFNVFEKDSKWGLFGNVRYEHNRFLSWEDQVSAFVGPSYRFLNNDKYTLIGRAGLGGRYKDNGPTDNGSFTPEAQIGADFSWKINAREKFQASTTVYPSLKDVHQFRSVTTAAYDLAIDSARSLRIAVEHDYDSAQTNPYRKSDVKYWVAMVFKL